MISIKTKRRKPQVVMSSLADVAFLLLIFLIVSSTASLNKETDIILPVSEFSQKITSDRSFDIFMNADGTLIVDGTYITPDELQKQTAAGVPGHPETVFFIKADESALYKDVDTVLEVLKQNNIQNVVLTTRNNSQDRIQKELD